MSPERSGALSRKEPSQAAETSDERGDTQDIASPDDWAVSITRVKIHLDSPVLLEGWRCTAVVGRYIPIQLQKTWDTKGGRTEPMLVSLTHSTVT
jgi:hypothetical protein